MSDDDKGGIVLGGIGFGVGTPHSGSAAPAARPNAPVEVDGVVLPMRILVVGDFIPRQEFNGGINPPNDPVDVPAAELDVLFTKLAPRLAIDVESVLWDGKPARIDVPLTSLSSFRPDALCQNVPLLRALLDGKKVLERVSEGALHVESAAGELARLWQGSPLLGRVLDGVEVTENRRPQPTAAPLATRSDDAADRILDMLDLGVGDESNDGAVTATPPTAPSGGRFDSFLAAVAHSGRADTAARATNGIRVVENALSLQLGAILQHPEFRRLEEAWRGLGFLVARMPKSRVRLSVLSCRTEESPEALRRVAASAFGVDSPVTLAVIDAVVGGDAASLAWLRELAAAAEENALVAITNAGESLYGAEITEVDRLDNKAALFESPARAPWRAEANRPAALWVSLAVNRMLARQGYDTKTSRIREASVAETPNGPRADVWMQPAWAIATLAAESFGRYEWPCGIAGGARDGGVVKNLPVREIATPYGERIAIPTEAFLSTDSQRALGRVGLTALASQPNSDSVYLATAATAYVPPPKRTYDGGADAFDQRLPQASLGDQLFVARLAQQLEWLGQRIVRLGLEADAKTHIEAGLGELFRNAPPSGPEVDLQMGDDSATVTVRPRRFLGVSLDEISLRVPLR